MLVPLAGFVAGSIHVLSGPDHLGAIAPLAAAEGNRSGGPVFPGGWVTQVGSGSSGCWPSCCVTPCRSRGCPPGARASSA